MRDLEEAFEAGDVDAIRRVIDKDYADPLGDGDVLVKDLDDLVRASSRRVLSYSDLTTADDPSALTATMTGRLDLEVVGRPTIKAVGPAQIQLVRSDRFRVRSGLLSHVRDIEQLLAARKSALEANDAAAMRPLLHPAYRDGDIDRDDAVERLAKDLTGVPVRLTVTNHRIELRGPTAHVDEHYVLTVGKKPLPPSVARFTLARTAGRWKLTAGLYPPDASERLK